MASCCSRKSPVHNLEFTLVMLSISNDSTIILYLHPQTRPFTFSHLHTMPEIPTPAESASSTKPKCPQCGYTLSGGTPADLCPKCLLLGVPDCDAVDFDDPAPTIPMRQPRSPTGASAHPPAWEPPMASDLQAMLPQYEVMELLGRGGMGAVYKGRQIALDRLVAIKILNPEIGNEEHDFVGRFNLESRAMAKLKHPGIVAVYDCGQTPEGLLYFVMELVEGMDVQRMIAQEGRLHSANAIAIAAHVCEAMQYAHERGIIHRDIKPANIMVDHEGHVKVADFGLVKMANASATSTFTISGTVMGTPQYIAPEALILGTSVDHRADIYAVGVMLYQMLTGHVPHGVFELPSLKVPGLDPRLDSIIARAMRENRDQRYQSAGELRSDLVSVLTQPVPQNLEMSTPAQNPESLAASSIPASRRIVAIARVVAGDEEEDTGHDPAIHEILRTTNSMNATMLVLGGIALLIFGTLAFFLANRKTGDVITAVSNVSNSETHNTYFTQLIATGVTTAKDLETISDIRPYGTGFIAITQEEFSWSQAQELARRTGAQVLTVENNTAVSKEALLAWLAASYSSSLASTVWVREHGEARTLKGSVMNPAIDLDQPRKAVLQWDAAKTTNDLASKSGDVVHAPPPAPSKPSASSNNGTTPRAAPAPFSASSNTPPMNPAADACLLEWVNKDGRVIQARFLKLEGEAVAIEKDGSTFTVPLANLSPASVEQARRLHARSK